MSREAMQQALEALDGDHIDRAYGYIQEALAQPAHAPTYSELDRIASDLQALCDQQALRLEALEAQEPVYSSGLRARSQTE